MRYAHIRKADLNLLTTFVALVEERSIKGAAARMHLSQPAMSRCLDRLQEMFQDELLVRSKTGYVPTQRAMQLFSELQDLLPRLEGMLQADSFDPKTATDTFRIISTDYAGMVLLPNLMPKLCEQAPYLSLEIHAWTDHALEDIGKGKIDLALWIAKAPEGLCTQLLFHERFACLVSLDHPIGFRRLTLSRYLEHPHILVTPSGNQQSSVDAELEKLGKRRNITLRIPDFAAAAFCVQQSNLILTVPRRLAMRLSTIASTRICLPPMELDGFDYIQAWHPRSDNDPGHRWLRQTIAASAAAE